MIVVVAETVAAIVDCSGRGDSRDGSAEGVVVRELVATLVVGRGSANVDGR